MHYRAAVGFAISLVALLVGISFVAESNTNSTIVLHAVEAGFGTCELDDPCDEAGATVNIIHPGVPHVIYVLIRNYDSISGFACAFDWDPGWIFGYGIWDCQGGFACDAPVPSGPGPILGALGCGFACNESGYLVVGRMIMLPQSGCMRVIESAGNGAAVYGCDDAVFPVNEGNRGAVCVGAGGYDACDPAQVPVEGTTWGRIKRQYGP